MRGMAEARRGSYHLARWPRNSGRRSAFATSLTVSPTIAFGEPRRESRAKRPVAYIFRTSSIRGPPDVPPGMVKLRLIKNT